MDEELITKLVSLLIKYGVDYDIARLIVLDFQECLRDHR